MKKGLTQPPVDAPTLPEGYYYDIRFRVGDMGPDYWGVAIREDKWYQARRGWGSAYSRDYPTHELAIRRACEKAYDNMVEQEALKKARDQYEGEWSGQ